MSINRTQQNSLGEFDYNVKNYSIEEIYDIFGLNIGDPVYIINKKMTEFFETSRRNPLMTNFLRDAQATIFNDLEYRGQMTEDVEDDNTSDNIDTVEDNSLLSSKKKLEEYYPSTLVVNDHKENLDNPLDSTPGGDGTINPFVRRTYRKEVLSLIHI